MCATTSCHLNAEANQEFRNSNKQEMKAQQLNRNNDEMKRRPLRRGSVKKTTGARRSNRVEGQNTERERKIRLRKRLKHFSVFQSCELVFSLKVN